jgi:hypothetical protein
MGPYIFGQVLLVEKRKTISKEKNFHKSYATGVAIPTMKIQYGGYNLARKRRRLLVYSKSLRNI